MKRLGPGRHADGHGLYLEVDASGWRRWFWRGVVQGRRREVAIGPVDLYPLAEARETARRWRRIAREGGDPVGDRNRERHHPLTFEQAARRVHAEQVEGVAKNAKATAQWLTSLEAYAFPVIGSLPVHAITRADVLRVLSPIWTTKPETARRVRQRMRTVFAWATTAGHREGANPVDDVEQGLPRQREKVRHHPALGPTQQRDQTHHRFSGSGFGDGVLFDPV